MPVNIKVSQIKYKDANGDYIGINGVSERATAEEIAEIEAACATAETAMENKAAQTIASIPSDYTELSDAVNNLVKSIGADGDVVWTRNKFGITIRNSTYPYYVIPDIIPGNDYLFSIRSFSGQTMLDIGLVAINSSNSSTTLITGILINECYLAHIPSDAAEVRFVFHSSGVEYGKELTYWWYDINTGKNRYGELFDALNIKEKYWEKTFYKKSISNSTYPYVEITDIEPGKQHIISLRSFTGSTVLDIGITSVDSNNVSTQLKTNVEIGKLYSIFIPADSVKIRFVFHSSGQEYGKEAAYWLHNIEEDVDFYAAIFDMLSSDITKYRTYAVIGDSWSTFKGYMTPDSNNCWYPTNDPECDGYGTENTLSDVEDTWWSKLSNNTGIIMVENRSFSGSTICYDGYGTGQSDGKDTSFVERVKGLDKHAELIFIEGGINDSVVGASLGEYKYSDWTESDLQTFRPAVACLIDYIKKHNAGAKIIFLKYLGMGSDYSTSITEICQHYSVPIIGLSNIANAGSHPTAEGMQTICNAIITFLSSN